MRFVNIIILSQYIKKSRTSRYKNIKIVDIII